MRSMLACRNLRSLRFWVLLVLLVSGGLHLQAQTLPAFPGAEGAGMYTTGGRGTPSSPTTVFEVTNLNDDNNPGSLRYALQASTSTYPNRTIVFRVSGTIHLTSKLNIRGNVTLAGQTAPGDGICVADFPVVISGNNVIIRYMRFRMGDKNQNKGMVDGSGGDDALGGLDVSNVIIDHCSVSWSDDEALTIYRGDNITLQWNLISEPLNYSYHFETGDADYENHGYCGIWGGKRASMHHNLLAHAKNRMPRFAGISTYSPAVEGAETVDLRNNVIYDWGINNCYGGEGGHYNVVNNYYKYGPSTSSGVKYRICNPSFSATVTYGKWYVDGNYVYGSATNTADNWAGGVVPQGGTADIPSVKAATPWNHGYSITTQSATDAYAAVLSGAGCILPNRDTLDQRIVNDVKNGTGRLIDVQGGYPHGTPYASTVNAWPALASGNPPADTDHDGMPDSWETANGLNPADASDRNTLDASGYTKLEIYLNSINNTNPAVVVAGTLSSFSQVPGIATSPQTFSVSGSNLSAALTVTAPANYQVSTDGTTWAGSLSLAPASGTVNTTTIYVRQNASADGAYSGNIVVASTGVVAQNVPVSGTYATPANGITATGTLNAFSQVAGTPTAAQTFTVSGYNLTDVLTVTPPANYQVSANGGTTWATSLTLNPVSGYVAPVTVSVRLNAGTSGINNGNIVLASTGSAPVNLAVTGTTAAVAATSQVIGNFPDMDGGFENQPAGANTAIGTTAGSHTSTSLWVSPSAFSIAGTDARTGGKSMHWNTASTSTKYIFTPVLTTNALKRKTSYVVQFWYRLPGALTGNATNPLLINGYTTLSASVSGSNNSVTANQLSLNSSSPTGTWTLFRSLLTTQDVDPSSAISTYAGIKIAYPQSPYFDMDDYVVYEASAFDDAVPDAAAGAAASGNLATRSIAVNWTAPATGTDGGGYVVVRSTSATAPVPNANGVYNVGNAMGDATVVYIGTGTSFTDNGTAAALTTGVNYYYYIFTVDKAFNYNAVPAKVAASLTAGAPSVAATGTLSSFSQVPGTPSASKSLTVSGVNLTGDITVTAPAGFEVSIDDNSWNSSVTLSPSAGVVDPSTIFVRLNASSANTYAGNITIASAGAAAVNVAVTGTAAVPAPVVNVSGSLTGFTQTVGTPSAAQTFTVSGSNLTGTVTVTPPSGFELSNGGTAWSATALTLAPSAGSLAATTLSVRLNASAVGVYNGNIGVASAGATTANLAVSGTAASNSGPAPVVPNVIVALDGSGNYTSIQAAINAAPANSTTPYIIYIKNGKYKEKISINKPFIQLVGQSVANTIISWDSYSGKVENGITIGTNNSGTVTINSGATDFLMMDITVENASGYVGDGPQALAIYVVADRAVFKNCRFISGQDTIWHNGTGMRHYFKNCYIDGNTDFIFGGSIAVFDSCTIHPRDRVDGGSGGYVTAANTAAGQAYGEVFRDCILTKNRGVTSYSLGRPWQNDGGSTSKANNKTVYLNCQMGSSINATGWSTWDAGTDVSLITYAEYKTKRYDGTLMDVSKRVSWSKQLTDAEAAAYYNNTNLFGTWDPCSASAWVCYSRASDIAVSNIRAKKGTSSTPSTISWNLSWPKPDVTYELFRSTDKTNFTKINEQTSAVDSVVAFSYADAIPPAGVTYYYYVKASKAGFASHSTDTVVISSTPTITVTGTLNNFIQGVGTPSVAQAFSVAGVNLSQGITITVPAGYELSADNGANWSSRPLVLAQSSNAVAATTILVRLNGTAAGSYAGNIVLTSAGAAAVQLAANGTVQTDPLPLPAVLLQQWPLTVDNQDDASVRSTAVTASTPVFNGFVLSNGLTNNGATLPAYGSTYGEAFAASADGFWISGSPIFGPGGNLNRGFYQQYTVTAKAGYSVRIDTLAVNAAFYGTSSNTKLAVVYSKSGFASDSANVSGGLDPAGVALISTANGGFTTPVLLANQTGGPTNRYALALNGATGVTLAPGETITFRLYYSCGSTSNGRYAMMKNVTVKGLATAIAIPAVTVGGTLNSFTQTVGAPATAQTFTVGGTNLTGNITLTAPAGYELSNGGAAWSSTLSLAPASGTVNATTISVRLNATAPGSYAGNISIAAAGATSQNLAVSGTAVLAPVLAVNGTLGSFSQTVGTPSAAQSFAVNGSNLTAAISVSAPAGYQLSQDGTTWSSSLSLSPVSGSVSATLQVRLNATAAGTFAGNISLTTSAAAAQNLAVSGTALPVPVLATSGTLLPYSQAVVGTPASVQSYKLWGAGLQANVTVKPPVGYEVSVNGSDWYTNSNPLVLTPNAGKLDTTTIQVRLNAGSAGNFSGSISNSSMLVSGNVTVTGIAYMALSVSPNPVTDGLLRLSHPQFYTVSFIRIYSLGGVKLKEARTQPATSQTTVDVHGLASGVYLLQFENVIRAKSTLKFVIP